MADDGARFSYFDLQPSRGSFLQDVLDGLALTRKTLPPKYFYDARGSALFEAICEQPEYYPTRTELAMLGASATEIARCVGPECSVVEFGTGSGRKTHILLGAVQPMVYVAIDIACDQLRSAMAPLAASFPDVRVAAVCADYSESLTLPLLDELGRRRRIVFFPGSTIGNFLPGEARAFLRTAHAVAGKAGAMLVGVDLEKDPRVLDAAYNDAAGVTAAFNLNLLHRMNGELGADFDVAAYRHRAFYNPVERRVEMHLESTREQVVPIAGRAFHFAAGETVHTENSYKYTVTAFQALAESAGFHPRECWVDPERLFSIHFLEASA